MSEAKKKEQGDGVDQTLSEFARRVVEGERTTDLFGVDDGFINSVLHKAHQFYINHNFEKAETLLRGVTVLDSKQPYAQLLLGEVLLQRASFEEAASVLEVACELDADNPHAAAKLGEAYFRGGREVEAMPLLERAANNLDEGTPHHKRATALLEVARGQENAEMGQS